TPPPLTPLGQALAACGITGVMDASATTDASAAALLAQAHRDGALPQRLWLMSAAPLAAPKDAAFGVGPLKVLLDDHDLPPLDDIVDRIGQARTQERAVAVHCVTAGELALTLAAFETAGARPGDRIEHGGVIPPEAVRSLAELGLCVVTQSGFIHERGDRYLARVEARDHDSLYRCGTLLAAGVTVVGSSDAPYGDIDPWLAMCAAVTRRTRSGAVIGEDERILASTALELYLRAPLDLTGPARRVRIGEVADLCLLKAPLAQVMTDPRREAVAATLIGGRLVFDAR
ncbi:MAG: amidohydrolase, partial [Caulobacteraceae bacterium]|nr:amidohydrolase [Caulobacteraceae bacterium]